MAGSDQRLEALEDELKLLKGEVKRTLVDLRAFVMREDSPLNEPHDRRSARKSNDGEEPAGGGGYSRPNGDSRSVQESSGGVVHEQQAAAPAAPTPPLGQALPPGQPIIIGMGYPPPTQQLPPQPPPIQPPPAPVPTQETQVQSDSYQSNRVQADQPYRPEVDGHREGQRDRQPSPEAGRKTEEDYREPREQPAAQETWRDVEEHLRQDREDHPEREPRPGLEESRRKRRGENGNREYRPDAGEYDRRHERPRSRDDQTGRRRPQDLEDTSGGDPVERRRYDPMREIPKMYERNNGHRWEEYERGGNDYQTEFEDLEEHDRARPYPRDPGPSRSAATSPDHLDVNLISNLVRWAANAKTRIGPERLMDFLELYLRSGNHSREMKETIVYICSMVEESTYEADPSEEWVELFHQLHGILAGGMAITHKPRMRSGDGERGSRLDGFFNRGV